MFVNYYKKIRNGVDIDVTKEIESVRNKICTANLETYDDSKVSSNASAFYNNVMPLIYIFMQKLPYGNSVEREMYYEFKISKASGGLRTITAPKEDLKIVQASIAKHLVKDCKLIFHNSVHSYTKHRNCLTALQAHQKRNAKYFLKLDIKDFFPSCTSKVVWKACDNLINTAHLDRVFTQLRDIDEFMFYKGALPQGSPLSPILSNVVLQEFDYYFNQYCASKGMCYTRYADDLLISKDCKFDWQEVAQQAELLLPEGMVLKHHKTRYGSCNGKNWNLGLMYNKDKQITVGHKQKHYIQCAYHNLYRDMPEDFNYQLRSLVGLFQYYKYIEPDYFTALEQKLNAKGYITI